jgi:hypothetical protein
MNGGLSGVLHSEAPSPEHADALRLYGQFVGDWRGIVTTHTPDGTRHEAPCSISFGWILGGRAVQDVWHIPDLPGGQELPICGNWFGTTIRAYDPEIDAWRIFWIDPATNSYRTQTGRAEGEEIVQVGRTSAGALSRWRFRDITPESFYWTAELSKDDGATWQLFVEVRAKRV